MESAPGSFGLTTARARWAIIILAVLLFATTNLPWQLDDYDQAKQAYTSYEMVEQGHWLYQRTPNESVATKPPLVGWISAAFYAVTRWWEGAWRLPAFLSALGMLVVLTRAARAAYGATVAFVALGAFSLNLLSPRLATLVRTDMPLAFVIFLIGLQIWSKIRTGDGWRASDRAVAFVLLTSAMLIKGPIVYAFILPGLAAYQFVRHKNKARVGAALAPGAWSGAWPWILSLVIFLAWTAGGILRQPGFYDTVVVKEFAGRFTETVHRPQPIYFYLPHLLHKFAPWSVLMVMLAIAVRRQRRDSSIALQPATLWLICWCAGALLCMSLIPSKRVDRIYPVVPPLCLLLAAQVAAAECLVALHEKLRRWLRIAIVFACIFTSGYVAGKVVSGYRTSRDALVRFGRDVRDAAALQHWRYAVVGRHEEGMLLYLRRDHFLPAAAAVKQWRRGELDALVVRDDSNRPWRASFAGARVAIVSDKPPDAPRYLLLVRPPGS